MHTTERLVAMYLDGKSYDFKRDDAAGTSTYGGPQHHGVTGNPFGPARLHHVASLDLSRIPFVGTSIEALTSLPLVYGFQFDGCVMEYRFDSNEIGVCVVFECSLTHRTMRAYNVCG